MPRGSASPAALASALTALSPSVNPEEARRAADCAYVTSARLAREYGIVGWAIFNNGLINTGLRNRGLCYHYTEDMLLAFKPLELKTLTVHWAIAHPGNMMESNALVLTARGQPLEQGIVLDGWRHAGRLYWNAAAVDTAFGWHEDTSDYARQKMADFARATGKSRERGGATSR